jgi:hypothetical protein
MIHRIERALSRPILPTLAGLVALTLSLGSRPATAATFTVNSTADVADARPGSGRCQDNPGITCTTDADCTNAGVDGGFHDSLSKPLAGRGR